MKSFFWFTYPTAHKTLRNPKELRFVDIHRIRDVILPDLMEPLYCAGYRYGGTILNFPYVAPPEVDWNSVKDESEGDGGLDSSDVVVACTRLPVNDTIVDELKGRRTKRAMDQSRTWLECWLHNAVCRPKDISKLDRPRQAQYRARPPVFPPFFRHLDRGTVELSPEAERLAPHDFGLLEFAKDKGVLACEAGASKKGVAIAFLMTVPQIYDGGPRFLGAWGMGGRETFVWGYILRAYRNWRRNVEDLLEANEARLIMAEFMVPNEIPYPFPRFTISPEPKVVADIRLPRCRSLQD
jgi:hypothetical protein